MEKRNESAVASRQSPRSFRLRSTTGETIILLQSQLRSTNEYFVSSFVSTALNDRGNNHTASVSTTLDERILSQLKK